MSSRCLEQFHAQSSHAQTLAGELVSDFPPTPAEAALTGLSHTCSCTALSSDLSLGVVASDCPQPLPNTGTLTVGKLSQDRILPT